MRFQESKTKLSHKTTIKAYQILPKKNKKFSTTFDKDSIKKINEENKKNEEKKEINFPILKENDEICESTRSKSNENNKGIEKPSSFLRAKRNV